MLSPLMEKAWRVDEGIRLQQGIIRHANREYWRKLLLDIEERNLPDYERVLKAIPRVPHPFRIGKFFRQFLP